MHLVKKTTTYSIHGLRHGYYQNPKNHQPEKGSVLLHHQHDTPPKKNHLEIQCDQMKHKFHHYH